MALAARADPIRVVEAAYAWEPDDAKWLDGIVHSATGYDIGGGVIAYTVRVGECTEVTAIRQSDVASDTDADALVRVTNGLPPALGRQVCAPTEFVGNTAYRLTRLARQTTGSMAEVARTIVSRLPQMWALIGGDPATRAMLLCFPRPPGIAAGVENPFPHAAAHTLGLVGAHIGAALRLRSLVRPTAEDPDTEAVITPRGKLLHAEGPATTNAARTSLVQAVLASERARGRLQRAAPEEALREWTSLVQGRWTILDTVEHDGKRLILARRNRLATPGLLDLAADERDVVWLAAHGHSYKYIAYELGAPISTISGRLRRAMRKLRVSSRTELLQKLGVPAREK